MSKVPLRTSPLHLHARAAMTVNLKSYHLASSSDEMTCSSCRRAATRTRHRAYFGRVTGIARPLS